MINEYAEEKARKEEPRDAGEPSGDFVDLQARGWEKKAFLRQPVPPVPEDRKGCIYTSVHTRGGWVLTRRRLSSYAEDGHCGDWVPAEFRNGREQWILAGFLPGQYGTYREFRYEGAGYDEVFEKAREHLAGEQHRLERAAAFFDGVVTSLEQQEVGHAEQDD